MLTERRGQSTGSGRKNLMNFSPISRTPEFIRCPCGSTEPRPDAATGSDTCSDAAVHTPSPEDVSMRKFALSLVALFAFVGFTIAANVTIVKWDKDKDELTVKDDKDKEMTYKVTKETKVKNGDKEGDLEKTKA